jgi:hypothetical protein
MTLLLLVLLVWLPETVSGGLPSTVTIDPLVSSFLNFHFPAQHEILLLAMYAANQDSFLFYIQRTVHRDIFL